MSDAATRVRPEAGAKRPPPPPNQAASDQRGGGARRVRARRVDRIINRFDVWSVFKVSFVFYLCLWGILILAGVILWNGAARVGAIGHLQDFVKSNFALKKFEFKGDQILQGSVFGGLALVVIGTGFNVLVAVLFNLISDLTGGIRASVLELENVRPDEPRSS
jgi:hypothetical protein